MASLDHPNIVRYLGAQVMSGGWELVIFQEWVAGGSLSSVLAQFGGHFEEALIRRYMQHLLLGLAYLHAEGVVHRDIKGERHERASERASELRNPRTRTHLYVSHVASPVCVWQARMCW